VIDSQKESLKELQAKLESLLDDHHKESAVTLGGSAGAEGDRGCYEMRLDQELKHAVDLEQYRRKILALQKEMETFKGKVYSYGFVASAVVFVLSVAALIAPV
jgi:hypothetical protein